MANPLWDILALLAAAMGARRAAVDRTREIFMIVIEMLGVLDVLYVGG